jgi:hypothetical protein
MPADNAYERVVLTGGRWMIFNQDYLDFLDEYLRTIQVERCESVGCRPSLPSTSVGSTGPSMSILGIPHPIAVSGAGFGGALLPGEPGLSVSTPMADFFTAAR